MVCGATPPSTPPKGEHGQPLPVRAARPSRCRAAPQSGFKVRTNSPALLMKNSTEIETMVVQDPSAGDHTAIPLQPVQLNVISLGGNTIVQSVFAPSDRVLTVKEAVHTANGWPVWQQRLTWQGVVLEDRSTLGELSLPVDGATLQIVMRQGPSHETIALAKDVLKEGEAALSSVRPNDIREVKAMKTPPGMCLQVCLAALQLLASTADSIEAKRNGSPKSPDWEGCKRMLSSPHFLNQLKQIPSAIEQGTLKEDRMQACRRELEDVDPDRVKCASIACYGLIKWILSISRFYDNVAEITKQAGGGVTLSELTSEPAAR